MLNRMMFVYFVQKQGFLDNDPDYLRNRLRMVQGLPAHPGPVEGRGRFQQFYRIFLLRLFHEGLGQPEAQRDPELAALLGRVPFLNGGLFDVHDLERDNPDIAIPDEAFERVFDFFDAYQWHLDERPRRNDNEINPDVLGYIFEKYVNQKQMGAYYTKEDITGYISRNTVIPFLFDAARRECASAFGPDGGVRRLLRDDPGRYIYPAVAHGATLGLPDDIAAGPRRRIEARRLERSRSRGVRPPHRDVARGRRPPQAARRGPRQARRWRGHGDRRPDHPEPRHRALRTGCRRLERGAGTRARVLARAHPRLRPRPHLRLRRVPLRRPQRAGAPLHRLPGGDARLPGRPRTLQAAPRLQRPQRLPQGAGRRGKTPQRALLHPQVHRPQQPLRRGHRAGCRRDMQTPPLPQARRPVGDVRPDRAAAGHRLQRPRGQHPRRLHLARRRRAGHDDDAERAAPRHVRRGPRNPGAHHRAGRGGSTALLSSSAGSRLSTVARSPTSTRTNSAPAWTT